MRSKIEDARDAVDSVFGKGFAKQNPDFLGAFMQSEAIDALTATVERAAFGSTVGPGAYPGALEMIAIALGTSEHEGICGAINRLAESKE